ncbi:XrtB/PEP-CTERM-associated polysaccharide biosynthesis outer membrane protein EpsL [uncultured Oxalicibacterium sp.]|uniref:XrtB/PEP-CTERM-associated polysaccharide biosynthesis outer membrane protein EpsL n=1 Tax=uncultured Oxalicibacterium sp. TaxID=1168540 RepID=UPI0025CEDAD1|nr:XrtB/PEP-CTERM-associated polysaccharide biosynthesis outer membrane protein EpsL [uncultured Oxalicibacterium sp.]
MLARHLTTVFVTVASVGLVHAAPSEQELNNSDTFTPYVGYGVFRDDNISRQPDNGVRVSDTWRRTTVGVRIDKPISRQRIIADLSVNDTKYDRFSELDNDGRRLLANWNWVLGNQLSGTAGSSLVENLAPFEDVSATGEPLPSSVRTQRRSFVTGNWRFHPSWRVGAGFNRDNVSYEGIPSARLQLDTTDLTFDYLPRSQNRLGLLLRHGEGRYPNQFGSDNSDYTQNEIKANLKWQLTGKTGLDFLGGWARRTYDVDPNRNFSGPDGRLALNWDATGKTSFTAATWRQLGVRNVRDEQTNGLPAQDDLTSNYSRNTGASLGAVWKATGKITVDATTLTEDRDYNRIDRSDRYRKNIIGVTYLPLRKLNVRLAVYDQELRSNVSSATTYRTKGVQLATRYEF